MLFVVYFLKKARNRGLRIFTLDQEGSRRSRLLCLLLVTVVLDVAASAAVVAGRDVVAPPPQDTLHQDTLHQDTLHQDTLHQDTREAGQPSSPSTRDERSETIAPSQP